LAKGFALDVSFNFSSLRFVLCAAACILPMLCGCFMHGDVPLQPVPPVPAAHDPPEKGLIHGPKSAQPASTAAAAAENVKSAGVRGLMLRGGWCRIALTPEESVVGVYSEALAKPGKVVPEAAKFRYQHSGLEQFMARPAAEQTGMAELLSDGDRNVAVTAAIGLARQGNVKSAPRLIAAIEDDELLLPARCAAVEALGVLPGDNQVEILRKLADRYGQFAPGVSTGYQADLHAEVLRALARHIDAGDDPRFISAVEVPSVQVRIETVRAWAAATHGTLPPEIVDLRSDGDPRVRAATLTALAARKHPAARDFLSGALHDVDLSVRLAAIRGLGHLDDAQARTVLADLLKDRSELIRAEAVAAIAVRGSRAVVLGAMSDASWRVRLKVAEALAGYADRDGAAVARRLLDDPSAEVERQVVRSLNAWPWKVAGPVLLDALGKDAVSVRKLAAEQIATRWPGAGRFPFEAPPARRVELLGELQTRYQHEFSDAQAKVTVSASTQPKSAVSEEQVEKFLAAGDFKALAELGPTSIAVLERLAIDRRQTLPEPVYHDVLPRHSEAFAALDRMQVERVDQRRRAAEELVAAANKQPLGRLAVARLCQIATGETDAVVWLNVLEAARNSNSEPAVRMARLALGQKAGEVRRRGCEYLAAHPEAAHETFLLPLLDDAEQEVVVAAIRALGVAGRIRDIDTLKKQSASANEEVQLEVAIALMRLHEKSGEEAIERLSYSSDVQTRARVAQTLGAASDARLAGILIRLLDDPKATVSHAALASLPKLVGRELGQSDDGATVPTIEQMARWKKWYAEASKQSP
jgi:HEAT repeat protein